ncbi:hypothetical protein AVEN_65280-1 [Araneus ventricosus]|uniref:Uncharacterized protein n=1 Tax=Araneus ventricosus TaxID=182803 RepID=A0A4Y2AIF8_ARAVE|nr:hypothetical protein AVEN_65280-1 [Araneus ventricosus]
MSLSRVVLIINLKREVRTNETVEESFIRNSSRNERSRVIKRFCVQREVSELQEHSCGTMTGLDSFCLAHFWGKEDNPSGKYKKMVPQ